MTGGFTLANQVVLRGMGANSTFLIFSGAGACNGVYAQFIMCGSQSYAGAQYSEQNIAQWTAGFAQGSTSITLTSNPIVATSGSWASGTATLWPTGGHLLAGAYITTSGFAPSGWNVPCRLATANDYSNNGGIKFLIASNPGTITTYGTMQQCGFNITANSTAIVLDQQDTPSDNGNLWVNAQGVSGNFGSGGAREDGTCSSSVSPRVGFCTQQQQVLVTACSPSCAETTSTSITLTISPGLYMPNWNNSAVTGSTGAFWANTTAYQMGVEDLSADLTNTTAGTNGAVIMNAYECWVARVRFIDPGTTSHVWLWSASRSVVRDSYFYQSSGHLSEAYGIQTYSGASDNLFENNIFQQVTDSTPNNNGGGAGNVAGYNFAAMDIYYNGNGGWFQPSDYEHSGGVSFWLREGNDTLAMALDAVHGTHSFATAFRNRYPGWQVAGCQVQPPPTNTPCVSNTGAINLHSGSRYINVIGNVLGQAGYMTAYQSVGTTGNPNLSVYPLEGYAGEAGNGTFCANPACSSTRNDGYDPLSYTSLMRWGNWDTVNGSIQWNSAEVPSALVDTTGSPSVYANPLPSSQTLPASFYNGVYTAHPNGATGLSYWKNATDSYVPPYPPAGPDVTGGNMLMCTSGPYKKSYVDASAECDGGSSVAAFGGHANSNPAMHCYLVTMGGPPDGTGNVLPFSAEACYTKDPAVGGAQPAAPTDINAAVTPAP